MPYILRTRPLYSVCLPSMHSLFGLTAASTADFRTFIITKKAVFLPPKHGRKFNKPIYHLEFPNLHSNCGKSNRCCLATNTDTSALG